MASDPTDHIEGEPSAEPVVEARVVDDSPIEAALVGPQWLHPASMGFELLSTLRQFVWAAVLALLLAGTGSRYALVAAGLAVIVTAARSLLRFLTLRYELAGGELRINEGLVFRRHRTVPVSRIQNIDLLQNPLHHWLGVAEVRIETAGGQEPEATLRVLALRDVDRLRSAIFRRSVAGSDSLSPAGESAADSAGHGSRAAHLPESDWGAGAVVAGDATAVVLRIPTRRLVAAGLLSNRGLVLIPIGLGLFFQFDLDERIDFRQAEEYLPGDLSTPSTIAGAIGAAILVLAIFRIASAGWFLLRFHGYRLERRGEDLRISCGLFTRVSATVPRHRIQFISVQQTLLSRVFDLAAIRIETAGGAAKKGEDAAITVARRWFVPVLHVDEVASVVANLRTALVIDSETLPWQSPSPRARRRLVRLAVIRAVGIGGLTMLAVGRWGFIAGVVALPPLVYLALRYARSLKYARSDRFIIFRSGIFTRKTSLTFFDKVQTVEARETPFDRRWGMATLKVDTAAAGPARHRIEVKYLPRAIAFEESLRVAAEASKSEDDTHV